MKPIRKAMRFFHMLLPHVINVRFDENDTNLIRGDFDLSHGYDPFQTYDEKTQKGTHLCFRELEHDPFDALKFIRKWGPLRLSEADPTEDGVFLGAYVHAMS